ncbi:hypothetical protein [Caulobacter phage Cr30]|uniref:hypothetical protein n=1 Tax=Caulobacter phage Cr30 TaxID=1357714 RepID=UPI0004A9B748|nr:hypothetical protein OZ74_gp035 [Caulobacter phage Cr30]AGS80920.1 hypothetical protein [Caulobacter phage Cr30]
MPASFNTNGKGKRKLNVKQKKALSEHEEWLKKRGIHSSQIAERKKKEAKIQKFSAPVYFENKTLPPTSDKVGNGFVRSIFEGLDKESEETRAEILRKAQRVDSLYSKGPCQYITDGTDITMIGSRSRRG